VLSQSSNVSVPDGHTANATLNVLACPVDFTLLWNSINFGDNVPSTNANPAPGNSNNLYNISVSPDSCYLDIYIRGTNLTNSTTSSLVGVGNITWSNYTNSYPSSVSMKSSNVLLSNNTVPANNVTTWYWLNMPPVYAGRYNGSIIITGVKHV
jgi:hypothetical protein